MERERGYTFCKSGDGKPRKGIEVTGDSNSVVFPISCPPGSKPRALMHTHPAGSLEPSLRDLQTMREKRLPICIRAGNRIKCWREKK